MQVRAFRPEDRQAIEALMDDFGDEIARMDPEDRVRNEPGYGPELTRQMLDDAERLAGLVLVAEDEGQIVGCASGIVQTRDERTDSLSLTFATALSLSCTWHPPGEVEASVGR
jgi:hypothetical protein